MEVRELMSPTVAIPVFCVLFCAFFVFAIGFKSPAQPPSFDVFDEDSKKKRSKKSKSPKAHSNGSAVPGGEGDAPVVKQQPSPRQAAKPAAKTQTQTQKAKSTVAPQEQTKKTKKQTSKDVEITKANVPKPEALDDVDGWHTVSVSKKDKKQKKKEPEKVDEEVKVVEQIKVEEVAPVTSEVKAESAPASPPQEQRNKKKKDKKNKKLKTDAEVEASNVKVKEEPAAPITKQPTPPTVVEPSIVELQIKEAMETVDEDFQVNKKKSKGKKKSPSPPLDDYVIPKIEPEVEAKPVPKVAIPTDSPSTKASKKKQKKDKKKTIEIVEEKTVSSPDSVDVSLPKPLASTNNTKETEAIPVVEAPASSPVATFDELGGQTESWEEAKPKSKKKKARRAD